MAERLVIELDLSSKKFKGEIKKLGDDVERNLGGKKGSKSGQSFGDEFLKGLKDGIRPVSIVAIGNMISSTIMGSFRKALDVITTQFKDSVERIRVFGRSVAEVNTLLEDNAQITGKTRGALERLAREFGTSRQIQAKGFYDIISAGIEGTSRQLDVLKVANEAAIGGITDVKTAASAIVRTMNAYGQENISASKASDILFNTVKFGVTTFPELAESIGDITPLAAKMGVTFKEVGALVAFATKQLGNTPKTVTALRNVLSKIIGPTADAKKQWVELGGAAEEFSLQGLKKKGGLVPFLRMVIRQSKGSSKALKRLFPDIRGLTGILTLAGTQFEEYVRINERFVDVSNATARAANIVKKELDFKIKRRIAAFRDLTDTIFKEFIPVLGKLNDSLTRTFTEFSNLVSVFGASGAIFATLKTGAKAAVPSLKELLASFSVPMAGQFALIMLKIKDALMAMSNSSKVTKSKIKDLNEEIKEQKDRISFLVDGLENYKKMMIMRGESFNTEFFRNQSKKIKEARTELDKLKLKLQEFLNISTEPTSLKSPEVFSKFDASLDPSEFLTGRKNELSDIDKALDNLRLDEDKMSFWGKLGETIGRIKDGFVGTLPSLSAFSKGIKDANGDITEMVIDFEKMGEHIAKVAHKTIGVGVAGAFKAMGRAMAEGKSPLKEFGRAVLDMVGNLAAQIGQMFILEGIAISFNPLMGGPAVGGPLIAAGAALSLFGGMIGGTTRAGHTFGEPLNASQQTSSGGAGGSFGGSTETQDVFGPESIHEKQVGTVVNVNVAGDILDSDQTGKRLVDLINDAFNHQGVVIEQGIA